MWVESNIYLPMKMEQSVPKRRHTNSGRRVISQRKHTTYRTRRKLEIRKKLHFITTCTLLKNHSCRPNVAANWIEFPVRTKEALGLNLGTVIGYNNLGFRSIPQSHNEDIKTDHHLDQVSKHSYGQLINYLTILCHLVWVVVTSIIPHKNKIHSRWQSA